MLTTQRRRRRLGRRSVQPCTAAAAAATCSSLVTSIGSALSLEPGATVAADAEGEVGSTYLGDIGEIWER